jgi:hypothetical protein
MWKKSRVLNTSPRPCISTEFLSYNLSYFSSVETKHVMGIACSFTESQVREGQCNNNKKPLNGRFNPKNTKWQPV